jgi:hypothetical protein
MDTKRLGPVDIKDEAKGEFSAVIATYGVIDKDLDVTLPGAHKSGQRVVVSPYNHSSMGGASPVGAGTLQVEANRTVVKGAYFMDIPEARSAFLTMKRLHEQGLGEWSYGYEVTESEMGEKDGQRVRFLKSQDVFEVSHVLRGAGVGTRTLAAKEAAIDHQEPTVPVPELVQYKAAIRPHASAVTAREWDGTAVVSAIPDDASVSDLRSVFAWVDSAGDPEAKTNYRFPHHHGTGGPANVRALVAGIAVLNGARGGTTIPDVDRKAVYNHLASHLRDADREPPELRSADGGEVKNIDRLPALLDEMAAVVDDIREVGSSRAAKGKKLSSLTFEALGWADEDLARVTAEVKRLLASPRDAAATEFVRFIAQQHRAAG